MRSSFLLLCLLVSACHRPPVDDARGRLQYNRLEHQGRVRRGHPPPDPLAGTLPRPEPDGGVYPIARPGQGPPRIVERPAVTCVELGLIRADPERFQCSLEVACRRWICYQPGACHGGAYPHDMIQCRVGGCPEGEICVEEKGTMGCGSRAQRCAPDCRSHGCGPDLVCAADGLCRPPDCRWADERCGPNTSCQETGDGWACCLARPCRHEADCDCGACVGTCQNGPGNCEQPRP